MKLAIMQPYFLPYLGYFQLVNAVNTFVFFDDVNFINKGWINRNNILQQQKPFRFSIPLTKASQNKLINEIELSDYGKWRKDFLKTIEMNYKKAPHFLFVFEWLNNFLSKDYHLISELASDSILAVSNLLKLSTSFKYTSSLPYNRSNEQNGQMKVLEICKLLGGGVYINPKNGVDLYDRDVFEEEGLSLKFIDMDEIIYPQFKAQSFVPYLSIIDVLMFNDIESAKELLNKYTLN